MTNGRGASPIDPVQIQNRIFPASSSPSNRVPRCELVFRKPPDPDVQKGSNINGRRYPYGRFGKQLILEHHLGILADMIRKPKRVALYLRVSTNGQSTENQKLELETVAARHGWDVEATYQDAGISGAKGRDKRPGLDRLLKAVARRDIDMIAAWSVDRLGRSLQDLLGVLSELHAKGVDLYLHQQGLDTSTPSGRAMFQMLGVFAEFERAMIQERVRAGLARARQRGKQLGRRRLEQTDASKAARIRAMRAKGVGIRRIASELGVGVGTVIRLTD